MKRIDNLGRNVLLTLTAVATGLSGSVPVARASQAVEGGSGVKECTIYDDISYSYASRATAEELCARGTWMSGEYIHTAKPPVILETQGSMRGLFTCRVRHNIASSCN